MKRLRVVKTRTRRPSSFRLLMPDNIQMRAFYTVLRDDGLAWLFHFRSTVHAISFGGVRWGSLERSFSGGTVISKLNFDLHKAWCAMKWLPFHFILKPFVAHWERANLFSYRRHVNMSTPCSLNHSVGVISNRLWQIIPLNYCQVIAKSYHFVFCC